MINFEFEEKFFDEENLKTATYFKLSQRIKDNKSHLKKKKIAIISSFTIDVIENYLFVELARRGIYSNFKFFPINQFEQQILDTGSDLYKFRPDVVILFPLVEDLCEDKLGFINKTTIQKFLKRFENWIFELRKKSNAVILSSNLELSSFFPKLISDTQDTRSMNFIINNANLKLIKFCNKIEDCYLFDYKNTIFSFGSINWTDSRFFFLAKIRQSQKGQIFLSKVIARYISAIFSIPKKCIVVDADNTLWGGVIGEEGLGGIDLSDSYPGNVFKEFHKYLLRQRSRGVILALASKNNEIDVINTLKSHKDSILKPKHFSSVRINWNDKARNIKQIASELNIGLDSIVFVDDNPVEREWIKNEIPEVSVPNLPEDPLKYIDCLERMEAFDFLSISNEDKNRAEMYYNESKRRKEKDKSNSLEQFLKGLKMKAQLEEIDSTNLKRVVQLLGKTNQFNLTIRRHKESEIKEMLSNGAIGITLRLSDKFGDSGLIGVAIAKLINQSFASWKVDSFLLSCRVLGRNVEDLLLSLLCERIKSQSKHRKIILEGEYIEGKKNHQVSDFYSKRGFKSSNGFNNKWFRDIYKYPVNRPQHIKVKSNEKRIRKQTQTNFS